MSSEDSSEKSSYRFISLIGNIYSVLGLFTVGVGILIGITAAGSNNSVSIGQYTTGNTFNLLSLLPAVGIIFLGLGTTGFGELLLAMREMVLNSRSTMEMTEDIQQNTLKQAQILERMMMRQQSKPSQPTDSSTLKR